MQLGISTACLYPMETEIALEKMLEMGFRNFEVFLNTFSELEEPYLKTLRRTIDAAGGRIVSVHPFTSGVEKILFFSAYKRRLEDGLEFYKRYYQAASILGASFVVLHGQNQYQQGDITEEEYIERYYRLRQVGKPFGVTLAQENVNAFRSEKVDFIQRMHDQLQEDCSFVLDIKQAFRAGQDPFIMAQAMGDRLEHIHINDWAPGRECLLPGQGDFDYTKFGNLLREIGYHGYCLIEVYRNNFGELSELTAASQYLSSHF